MPCFHSLLGINYSLRYSSRLAKAVKGASVSEEELAVFYPVLDSSGFGGFIALR